MDETRLAMEVALFADRASIDEELVRLDSHFTQLAQDLQADREVGRKIDFLLQEINREVNTIGSKANDLAITRYVVELKSELEKIREQVQNIE
ncbi:MAG: endoribonuclease YicC domain-containing protein [Peptococcia bacterium]